MLRWIWLGKSSVKFEFADFELFSCFLLKTTQTYWHLNVLNIRCNFLEVIVLHVGTIDFQIWLFQIGEFYVAKIFRNSIFDSHLHLTFFKHWNISKSLSFRDLFANRSSKFECCKFTKLTSTSDITRNCPHLKLFFN